MGVKDRTGNIAGYCIVEVLPFEDVAGQGITVAAETLSPEVVAAAQERGRKRDIWETAKALLEEFNCIQ